MWTSIDLSIGMRKRSTKLYLTFSEESYARLERWGKAVSRPLTNLGVLIIEQAIQKAIADGVIPADPPDQSTEESERDLMLKESWAKLIDGESLTPEEEELIAVACDRAPHNVHNIVKKIRSKNGNGKAETKR